MNRFIRFVAIVPVVLPLLLPAQQLSGTWRGTLTQGPGGCFRVYNLELNIKANQNRLSGASYHYSDITNYVKEEFNGIYTPESRNLKIREQKILTFHVPADCVPCIKEYTLVYEKRETNEFLTGEWTGVTMNNLSVCPPGKITLSRVAESDFNHIQEIMVDTGVIRLDFYDNAQIDGDIISVLLNNKPLITNQKLTGRPVTLEIRVDMENPEQEVTMVAENQGDIPPNTALLIITAGGNRYQLYLTSTEQKNAQVRFILQDNKKSGQ